MKIKLNQIFSSGETEKTFNHVFNISPDDFKKFLIKEFKPCNLEVKFYSINDKIFMDLKYKVDVVYQCARCLVDVNDTIEQDFSKEIVVSNNEEAIENDTTLYVENNEIDIEEILLKSLYLNLEPSVLCDENCKGLCPKCGTNLNDSKCDCDLNDIDPRFEKLKGLKDKLND